MTTPDGGSPFSSRFKDGYVVSPGPGSSPSFQQYVASARAGDMDVLHLMGSDDAAQIPDEVLGELAYKLLTVAADFGNSEAIGIIDDLLFMIRSGDRFIQGNAHFELGLAYLMGSDGLPADPDRSRAHLKKSHECQWPFHVQQGERILDEARGLLTAPQLTVFEEIYRPT